MAREDWRLWIEQSAAMSSGAAAARLRNVSIAGAIASASYMLSRNPAAAAETNLDPASLFAGPSSSSSSAASTSQNALKEQEKPRNDAPRTSAVGFDPEALERGAKALREINASNHAKKVHMTCSWVLTE